MEVFLVATIIQGIYQYPKPELGDRVRGSYPADISQHEAVVLQSLGPIATVGYYLISYYTILEYAVLHDHMLY